MTTIKTPSRKQGSSFDKFCNFINSLPIGTVYSCKELRSKVNIDPERLGYIHGFCKQDRYYGANVVKRVKRGWYEVLAHIPDFVTYNMLEANRGYKKTIDNPNYNPNQPTDFTNRINLPWLQVDRGLPWKAGQPNPYKTEEKKEVDLNQISNNGSTEQVKAAEKITELLLENKTVYVTDSLSLKVFIIILIDGSEAKVRSTTTGEIWMIPLIRLVNVNVTDEKPQPTKREQIIDILKQGLSAADAADKILTLF